MKRGFLEARLLVIVLLKILSTRLGTLLVCGSLCFSNKWPYINKFASISLEKRERILQKWLRHWFLTPIRLAFVFIKFLCLLVFFTQVIMLENLNYLVILLNFCTWSVFFLGVKILIQKFTGMFIEFRLLIKWKIIEWVS